MLRCKFLMLTEKKFQWPVYAIQILYSLNTDSAFLVEHFYQLLLKSVKMAIVAHNAWNHLKSISNCKKLI